MPSVPNSLRLMCNALRSAPQGFVSTLNSSSFHAAAGLALQGCVRRLPIARQCPLDEERVLQRSRDRGCGYSPRPARPQTVPRPALPRPASCGLAPGDFPQEGLPRHRNQDRQPERLLERRKSARRTSKEASGRSPGKSPCRGPGSAARGQCRPLRGAASLRPKKVRTRSTMSAGRCRPASAPGALLDRMHDDQLRVGRREPRIDLRMPESPACR